MAETSLYGYGRIFRNIFLALKLSLTFMNRTEITQHAGHN